MNPTDLLSSKYAKKTDYATNYSKRLLIQFLDSRELKLENIDVISLNSELCVFYACLRKEYGDEMSSTSLSNIRYGLCRVLKTELNVDILKDISFTKSNEVFVGKLAKLKREGFGSTKHFDIISYSKTQFIKRPFKKVTKL
jgi:hypothetical protein